MPTNVAARMTLAADPDSLQGAVAAGILGCGTVVLGTAEACARVLEDAQAQVGGGRRAGGRRRRGRPPRSTRAAARCPASAIPCTSRSTRGPSGSSRSRTSAASAGPHVVLARCLRESVAEAWGKPLTMNVSVPMAAVHARPRLPVVDREGDPDPRPHGRPLAHLAEEQQQPIGFLHGRARGGGDRVRASRRRDAVMLDPEVEARPWDEQVALDDAAYRAQLGYLLERSAFYRRKLGAAGVDAAQDAGGLAEIGAAPADREARAQGDRHAGRPDRRAPAAPRARRSSGSTRRAARRGRRATSR